MKPSRSGLVEGAGCGGQPNALVGLARQYGQGNERAGTAVPGLAALTGRQTAGDRLARDFLVARQKAGTPQSFDMRTLLAATPSSSAWASEFGQQQRARQAAGPQFSSGEFLAMRKDLALEAGWAQANNLHHQQQHHLHAQQAVGAPGFAGGVAGPSTAATSSWSADYLSRFDDQKLEFDEGRPTDAVPAAGDNWADEYFGEQGGYWRGLERAQQYWADGDAVAAVPGDAAAGSLEEAWTAAAAAEYHYQVCTGRWYIGQVENPFLNQPDLLVRGQEMLERGDLRQAILAFEADARQRPEDPEVWYQLGITHAQNEDDRRAIVALRKCLQLQPNNKNARLGLAVSLANESLENAALEELTAWLEVHSGRQAPPVEPRPEYQGFLDRDAFAKVEQLYLAAARSQASQVDPELQNALGILYNLSHSYERAVDSLRLAVGARPDDPALWNRLGATLANGDRTADAIAAYREALRLRPTFVRARYNMGVSCMHLHSYRESLDHFVHALEMQRDPAESSIWTTARTAIMRLGGSADSDSTRQLLDACRDRDLGRLRTLLQQHVPSSFPSSSSSSA